MDTTQPSTMLLPGGTRTTFLGLLPQIRRRIYYFAGLIRSCPIAVVGSSSCFVEDETPGTLPTSLFLVSQHISFESLQEFFSGNRFMVIANSPSDLDDIRRLPRARLIRMRSLEVYINPRCITKTHNDNVCLLHGKQGKRGWREGFPLDLALEVTTAADSGMIWALDRLCKYLKGISYNSLHLICFCNAETSDIATRIHRSMQRLGSDAWYNCKARLKVQSSSSPDPLVGSSIEDWTHSAFPFFRLPAELRFTILSYTDLHPGVGSDPYNENLSVVNGHLLTSYWANVGENRSFRTISFPLFLVSKQMQKEAEHVLFFHNCLNVEGGILEAYKYLVRSPKERLYAIRHLRLCFQPIDISQWSSRTRPTWHLLVEFIGENLNTSVLCLAIDIGEHDDRLHEGMVGQGNLRFIYESICELVLDLCKLHLRDLHLNLPQCFGFLETLLEQKAVGPGYDSSHGNRKPKRANGSWFRQNFMPWGHRVRFGRDRGVERYCEVPEWHTEAWEAMTRSYGFVDEEQGVHFQKGER